MIRFENKIELLKSFGANLKHGEPVQDFELRFYETEFLVYVHKNVSKIIANLPEEISAYYIPAFGYCPAD